jgi:hypothetical protein
MFDLLGQCLRQDATGTDCGWKPHLLVFCFLLAAKGCAGRGLGLAGEIGFAGAVAYEEATELDDEFEAVGAGDGVPADVIIAFLESLGGEGLSRLARLQCARRGGRQLGQVWSLEILSKWGLIFSKFYISQ